MAMATATFSGLVASKPPNLRAVAILEAKKKELDALLYSSLQ